MGRAHRSRRSSGASARTLRSAWPARPPSRARASYPSSFPPRCRDERDDKASRSVRVKRSLKGWRTVRQGWRRTALVVRVPFAGVHPAAEPAHADLDLVPAPVPLGDGRVVAEGVLLAQLLEDG